MTEQHAPGQSAVAALWPGSNRFDTAWGTKTAKGLAESIDSFIPGTPSGNTSAMLALKCVTAERDSLRTEKAELVRWLEACLDMVRGEGPPNWDGIRAAIAKAKESQP